MALSTVGYHVIAGKTIKCSEWTAGHLRYTLNELEQKFPNAKLVIIQPSYNSTIRASAGTHDWDGVLDVRIEGIPWSTAQAFLRGRGWAAWWRHTGTWAPQAAWHIHMATIPPGLSGRPTALQVGQAYARLGIKVGRYIDGGYTTSSPHQVTTTSQIRDYFAHTFGLAGQHTVGADKSWFPSDIASTIYRPPTTAAKKATVTSTTPTVASLFKQITSLTNQIIAATTSGTPNSTAAYEIRAISHEHDGSN